MTNFSRNILFVFLLLSIFAFSQPCHPEQSEAPPKAGQGSLKEQFAGFSAWGVTSVKAGNFAPGKLSEHYLKHGYQFGQITEEQYLQGAQALLDATPDKDVLEKIRPNGDIEHFRESTGEFAVMTKRGRIRTYYKTNYWYWIRH